MNISTLLADPKAIGLEEFISNADSITMVVRSFQKSGCCPLCGQPSNSSHGNYIRRVADLPWHGIKVRLELKVRKFRCRNELCPRKIFCERLPKVATANGFAYFGTFTSPGRVAKVALSNFGSVNTLTLNPGEDYLSSAVIDTVNNFAYFGTGTQPGIVIKIQLKDGALPRLNTPFDFDGDGKSDFSIFRPSVGEWWYFRSSDGGNRTFQFGNSSDKLVPADYTGDGKTDMAFFRPSTNEWFVIRSEDSSFYSFPFGTNGDIPVPADYDGDGKTDPAVFRPSTQTWFILRSTGGVTIQQFGAAGDVPVVADYDGDGKADLSIYRPSSGQWWLLRSSAGIVVYQFGNSSDKPVPGDYTGDGKADAAFFRPSTNEWFVLRSENASFYSFPFGAAGDVPSRGDYDGDGKMDATVFRPSTNTWYAQRSTAGTLIQTFGQTGDMPVPNAFVS